MGTLQIAGPNNEASCCYCGCAECYCNCCACYPTGSLNFSIIDCSIDSVSYAWSGRDCQSCATWEFELEKDTSICYYHTSGAGGCSSCTSEYAGAYKTYPEAWSFSGTVCDDCTTADPPMISDDCGGMCVRASLCCCKTGTYSTTLPAEDRTCAVSSPVSCGTPPSGDYTCDMGCFWFQMSAYECYDIDGDGFNDSPCSPCAAYDTTFGPDVPGSLFTSEAGVCLNVISGQCSNPNTSPPQKFMAVVQGTFQIACDCQSGEIINPGTPGASYQPVNMNFQGLITEP